MVDVHGDAIPDDPNNSLMEIRLQVVGPGFAPFKPYLRPKYFYFRVSPFIKIYNL